VEYRSDVVADGIPEAAHDLDTRRFGALDFQALIRMRMRPSASTTWWENWNRMGWYGRMPVWNGNAGAAVSKSMK
jgi:hypothetical protein